MIRRLIDWFDLLIGWTFWCIVLFILAVGAYALGFGNYLIQKLKYLR